MTKANKTSSDPTLTKLLEVEAELTAQEAGLLAQLQTLQQKRQSLQTVIGMFAPHQQAEVPDDTSAESASTFASTTAQLQQVDTPEQPSEADAVEDQTEELTPRRQRSTTKQSRTTSRSRKGNRAPTGKRESWRPYLREEFPATASLPQVVSTVLQRLPERVFGVPELMNAIFKEELPPTGYQKAHRRLLTLLSQGVKDNQWARHDKGHYSAAQPQSQTEVEEGAA